MILKFLLSAFFISVFSIYSFADALNLTALKKNNSGEITIELNHTVILHGLKIINTETEKTLFVPYYNNNGYKTDYFHFTDRNFKTNLINDILKKQTFKKNQDKVTYTVNKFRVIENAKKLKASGSVIINNVLEINIIILDGKYGLWVNWPSRKEKDDKWTKLFEFKDKKLKKEIEQALLALYSDKTK